MEINGGTYKKLTQKEKDNINDIISRAEKRRKKKQFSIKFILKHLEDHGFIKSWNYDDRDDVIDMLHSIAEMQMAFGRWKEKSAKTFINYYTKEYANVWFPDDD